jgi:hypothetical protein
MPEPIRLTLSGDNEVALRKQLKNRLRALKTGLKPLFETNLPKWRRIYEAQPQEKTRDFPFQNASNLIPPLAGIHCDTLKARVVSSIWKTRPLWLCDVVGDFEGDSDDVRMAWQDYLLYNSVEPTELDLYNVETQWIGEIIKYGTSVVKVPYEKLYEDYLVPAGDGSGKHEIMRELAYQGPKPRKLAFEDFYAPPSANSLEDASRDIVAHRIRYQRHELMERRYTQFFKADKVDEILKAPDRTFPDFVQQQREQDTNARTIAHDGYAEWDVFECWLPWRAPNSSKAPRIIVWYHEKTDTILNAIYDSYSPILKSIPFILGRLLYRDDSLHGYGLCEVVEMLQEEISVIHNQRRDNMTVANTRVWRVDPDSKLHQGYQIFPSAMLPAMAGEIEPLQHGEISQTTIEEERLTMDLAERRTGVSPPMQGMGAGSNTKRGVYTAMGTLSLMQEGNSRTDMTIADIRNAHTKLGRVLSNEYAFLGLDESKLLQFGKMKPLIIAAAELIKQRKMALPINPSTASVNKEIEKQNDLMLSQIMGRHYGMVSQLLQQLQISVLPDAVKQYSAKVIEASEKLMKQILRHFDHDDVDALVPKALPQKPTVVQGGQNAGNQTPVPGAQQPTGNSVQPKVPASIEFFNSMAAGTGGGPGQK